MSSRMMFRCENGEEIPYFEKNLKHYLHRTTSLFGPSETGKTTIIREILFLLKDVIPMGIAIAPSDQSNESYTGILPGQCVHDDFDISIIERIYQRQKMACKIFNEANNIKNLMSLFRLIPTRDKELRLIKLIDLKFKRYIISLRNNAKNENQGVIKTKVAKAKEMRNDSIRTILKNAIRAYRTKLVKFHLTQNQKYVLKYLDFNPEILLILDDCADEFKKYTNHPTIRMLFYKARHFKITFLISFQDDKDLDSSLRKGSHIKIFTDSNVASTYIARSNNGFSRDVKKKVGGYIDSIYKDDEHSYEKLMYIRAAKEQYQVLLSDEYEFKFGSEKYWQLASRAPPPEEKFNKSNPFYDTFHV
jgi:hypothetical protein